MGSEMCIRDRRNSRHFFLVREVEESAPVQHERAWIARAILASFIVAASTFGAMGMEDAALLAALPAALLMIFCRCTGANDARKSIDWSVIVVMAAGLGIGEAMNVSGTTDFLVSHMMALIQFLGGGHLLMMAMIFAVSVMLTNMITAKAAGVLVLPIVLAASEVMNVDSRPLIIALIMGTAGSFVTPFGYQTNMMVYGPGGYRSSDYLRLGIPLSIIVGITTFVIAPFVWPFVR